MRQRPLSLSQPNARAPAPTAVGYLRRSTDRQEQSIPDQRRALEAYASENGLRIERLYVDDAISGTSTSRRKAFQQLVEDAQKPACTFQYVVVYDVKRFGRLDNDEAGYYRHILRVHGVEVLYVSENFSGDGTDDLLRPVKQWQAREESKDLSKVTIRGLLSRVKDGWWMGGTPPYGYDLRYENDRGDFLFVLRFLQDGTKEMLDDQGRAIRTLARGECVSISKRDRAKLVPGSSQRVAAIDCIFRMAAEQQRGYASIAEHLNAENIPTPRGPMWSHIYSGKWVSSSVREILLNRAYVGDMVWNRRTDGRFNRISDGRATERRDVYGARLVPNPEKDWIVVENTHPALVSRQYWERARQVRVSRVAAQQQCGSTPRVVGGWRGKRGRYLLSGLVRCAHCGGRYEGCVRSKGKPRLDGTRVRTHYYGCGSYIRRGRSACGFGPIAQEMLEVAIIDAVVAFYEERYGSEDGLRRLQLSIREQLDVESADVSEARHRAEAELASYRDKIAHLLDNLTPANRTHVDARIAELDREREAVQQRVRSLDDLEHDAALRSEAVDTARDFCQGLPASIREGPAEHRARVLRRCVEEVVVNAQSGTTVIRLHRLPTLPVHGRPRELVDVEICPLRHDSAGRHSNQDGHPTHPE